VWTLFHRYSAGFLSAAHAGQWTEILLESNMPKLEERQPQEFPGERNFV